MAVLSDIRDSKLFHLISDISVGHWIISICTGLLPSGGAMLAHQPFWIVFLVFILGSAAAVSLIYILEKWLHSLQKAGLTVLAVVLASVGVIWLATRSEPTKTSNAEPKPIAVQTPPSSAIAAHSEAPAP